MIIALTKGRIEKAALGKMSESGMDVSELTDKAQRGRKLIFSIPKTEYQIIISKPADVLTYVSRGIADIGVVGKDTLDEETDIGGYYEIADLKTGICRFAFAAKVGTSDFFNSYESRVIASKYPNVARKFFQSKGIDAEIVKIEGSVELAPILGLADGIVDIVETGATLKANGLEVVEDISPISTRVIANRAGLKMRKSAIEGFVTKLTGGN
ncbi:MAG: ATP phosphoribosyltransferase [Oscillospiraceae bacterium]|jgi:ATP phosphoribosyltransferase|nr:ATP phosphoribosyltransferase [Oscillospiraceae bacterium]